MAVWVVNSHCSSLVCVRDNGHIITTDVIILQSACCVINTPFTVPFIRLNVKNPKWQGSLYVDYLLYPITAQMSDQTTNNASFKQPRLTKGFKQSLIAPVILHPSIDLKGVFFHSLLTLSLKRNYTHCTLVQRSSTSTGSLSSRTRDTNVQDYEGEHSVHVNTYKGLSVSRKKSS